MPTRIENVLEPTGEYQPPVVTTLGSLYDLTLGCNKTLGASDGYQFEGLTIVCKSI